MSEPLIDHIKLLTSKVKKKGRLTRGPLNIVQSQKKKTQKQEGKNIL
jgi:hypothetical protein